MRVCKAGCLACFMTQATKECMAVWGATPSNNAKPDNLLDRMNATELAANQFRMTQTRDKLERERIHGQTQAIQTHEQV